jgi:soluble lytic murein transglycosylase-like protein
MTGRRSDAPFPERDRRASDPADRLREWEHPNEPGWQRWGARLMRRRGRAGAALLLALACFGFGTVVGNGNEERLAATVLEARLERAEAAATARRGELELVRIEMARLQAVIRHSASHNIPADLAADIFDIARAEGIDPALAFSLVRVESGFRRTAISAKGAVGLTQLMPSTAYYVEPGLGYADLLDRRTNLRIGFRYLNRLIRYYNGDVSLALLAYNRGPTRVDEIREAGGDPSNGYSHAVLGSR